MAPKLKVSAGSSPSSLTELAVNRDVTLPLWIQSEHFEGYVTVRIKEAEPDPPESNYFEKAEGRLSMSIQSSGRYLTKVNAHDLVFGNTFDAPIRNSLPYGTAAALRFVSWIDPPLRQDLYADKPWAWSPLFATMNRVQVHSSPDEPNNSPLKWDPSQPEEDVTGLIPSPETDGDNGIWKELKVLKGDTTKRRKWFSVEGNRKKIDLDEELVISTDFCNDFINFNNLSLRIPTINLEIPLSNYWNGLPVRYVCRTPESEGYREFWCVQFEIVDKDIMRKKGIETSSEDEEQVSEDVD